MEQDEFDSLADGSWKYEIESLRQQLAELKIMYVEWNKRAISAEVKLVECERERDELVVALEKIADTDPDSGTDWFHSVASAALAKLGAEKEQS